MGDRNLSIWTEVKGGEDRQGYPLRKYRPGKPVPQASCGLYGHPDVGGQWASLAGSG